MSGLLSSVADVAEIKSRRRRLATSYVVNPHSEPHPTPINSISTSSEVSALSEALGDLQVLGTDTWRQLTSSLPVLPL
eukprot:scaffold759_cov290-Alexandrium_tamarense.AAC.22